MAGVTVIGCILFAIVANKDGSFNWHQYTSIVGLFVLACAFSWSLSALTAIGFQLFRRLSRGPTGPNRSGPWGRHERGTLVSFAHRFGGGAHRWRLTGIPVLAAAAFISGFGGFLLFDMLTAGKGIDTRVNVFRGSAEIVRFGRGGNSDTTEKSAVQQSGGDYSLCQLRAKRSCVIDGDTIRYEGTKIRIADIDAPEISEPKCASEAALGHRAKERLLELLNDGPFEVVHLGGRDEDVYGRKLRVLMRGGRSLGMILVDEGLARRWTGARRSWCG